MNLLIVAAAPVFIIAFYIYFRDKYEKEPVGLLIKSMVAGMIIVFPVSVTEKFLEQFTHLFPGYSSAAYMAFIVAALTEEGFKFLALYLLIWKNRNFNELFDGIVYAVFVSLGFAFLENIMYVSNYGLATGITRAFTAVPAHALFGVTMGQYFARARYYKKSRSEFFFYSLMIPVILHGIYDFILMSKHPKLLLLFIPYIIFLWINGFKKINKLSEQSKSLFKEY